MPYGMTWDEFKPDGYSGSDWHDGPIISPPEPRKKSMNLRILKSDLADLKNPKILEKYPHLAKDVDKRIAELEALIKQKEEKDERLRNDAPEGGSAPGGTGSIEPEKGQHPRAD